MQLIRIDGRFRLKQNVGNSTQISIFRAVDLINKDHKVLVKTSTRINDLDNERAVLQALRGLQSIPSIVWSGMEYEYDIKYDILIFEDLGPTLDDVFKSIGRQLSMVTIATLAEQLITTLEKIHSNSYIHSNISPQNVLVAPLTPTEATNRLYLFDFGLSQHFRDPQTYAHVPFHTGRVVPVTRSFPFASINFHLGHQLSRRDDLESLAYVLIYLARGTLPWIYLSATADNDMLQQKRTLPIAQICDALPSAFATFLDYSRNLLFTQKPDYEHIRSLFHTIQAGSADSQPILSPTNEVSERTYWKVCLMQYHPTIATGARDTHQKRSRKMTSNSPALRKRAKYGPVVMGNGR